MIGTRTAAALGLAAIVAAALLAPALAPHDPRRQHTGYPYAPPLWPRVVDPGGSLRMPFAHPVRLVDRVARTYAEDRSRTVPVGSALLGARDAEEPVFLLGTDALGRDVLSRLLLGARISLGTAAAGALGAVVIGVLAGALAGYRGGSVDELTMRTAELILVLPTLYVLLAVRSALPLVLDPGQLFALVAAALALLGWPFVARGVRSVVSVERTREYVEAARACGASPARIVFRHVLPACAGVVGTQAALLVPAFVVAEAALSYAGFGFAEPTPSWGSMLQDAGNVRILGDHPWLLAPAAAIAAVSWGVHALVRDAGLLPARRA